jgi:hypothetical protein
MTVPIKRAMIDAPSSPPGIRCSSNTDSPATAKQMARPAMNKADSFDLILIFMIMLPISDLFYYIIKTTKLSVPKAMTSIKPTSSVTTP